MTIIKEIAYTILVLLFFPLLFACSGNKAGNEIVNGNSGKTAPGNLSMRTAAEFFIMEEPTIGMVKTKAIAPIYWIR